MSMGDAKKFFKELEGDDDFRKSLIKAEHAEGQETILKERGLAFTPGEFEEAYTSMLVQCQFEEHAEALKELYNMWKFVRL